MAVSVAFCCKVIHFYVTKLRIMQNIIAKNKMAYSLPTVKGEIIFRGIEKYRGQF